MFYKQHALAAFVTEKIVQSAYMQTVYCSFYVHSGITAVHLRLA